MAKGTGTDTEMPKPANLTPNRMRSAIIKLERRIKELKGLDITQLQSGDDPPLLALRASIEETLQEVYGLGTHEYNRYSPATYLDLTDYSLASTYASNSWLPRPPGRDYHGRDLSGGGDISGNIQQGINKGRDRAVALLGQAVKSLKEQLEDLGETKSGRALRAYEGLDLHPEIERASGKLYRDGHYANAIEDAVKVLNDLVRMRSGQSLDGIPLMQTVFSPNKPVLKFNDLADASDQDEQKGFMMMFAGAVAGLRNPRAHKLIKDDPERALEFIAFVSLLAKLLDGAKK
jgi:uncharacterized protein (TIGR02391 family)